MDARRRKSVNLMDNVLGVLTEVLTHDTGVW